MKRLNKKVSKLVSDFTLYSNRYQKLQFKEKYEGLTKVQEQQKWVAMYQMLICEQRLYLEHGISENETIYTKRSREKYYGKGIGIDHFYSYEKLSSHMNSLETSEADLLEAMREERKAKAAA